MKTQPVEVTRGDGETLPAQLIVCECGHDGFHFYEVAGHLHIQCTECAKSFCDGRDTCPVPPGAKFSG